MTNHPEHQITTSAKAADSCENEAGLPMPDFVGLTLDESAPSSDGLLLHGWDGAQPVTAFISRRVMDNWVNPKGSLKSRRSLFRAQYNALGKRNLPAIQHIVACKYRGGLAFNREPPFIDVLLSDINESGEVLNVSELACPLE